MTGLTAAIALLQSLHLLALSAVCGSTTLLNAELWRGRDAAPARLRPWLWTGFAALLLTGAGLAFAEPDRAWVNPAFRVKMALTAAAAAAIYAWGRARARSGGARALGVLVLLLLIAAVVAGRLIAYTEAA